MNSTREASIVGALEVDGLGVTKAARSESQERALRPRAAGAEEKCLDVA